MMESNIDAVAEAKSTAKRIGAEVDARQFDATRYRAGDAFFEVAILDPARAGAAGVMQELAVTRPRAIVYVACNPPCFSLRQQRSREMGLSLEGPKPFRHVPPNLAHRCWVSLNSTDSSDSSCP